MNYKKIIIIVSILVHNIACQTNEQERLVQILASAERNKLPIARRPFSKMIPIDDLSRTKKNIPSDFHWAVATSSTQIEEVSGNNTWSNKYLEKIPHKANIPQPGFAAKSWQECEDDIEKLINLGVNAYRFSIEWSRIQPTADTFDEDAIKHYIKICQKLVENNITPMVCLHHYSDPIWFMEEGGFAQPANIELFIQYCEKMYNALAPYVEYWIIISQPAAYALKSYKTGSQPPFAQNSGLETQVMINLFNAHIQVYDYMHDSFKKLNIGKKPQVGLSHQLVQMLPSDDHDLVSSLLGKHTFEQTVAYFADRLNNQMILQTFSTGQFPSMFPGSTLAYLPNAPQKFDFFALSYYSPLAFSWITPQPPHTTPDRQAADNFRIIEEQGLYDAIKTLAQLRNKPIYITETGIAPHNEEQRILFLDAYTSAVAQAIDDGYNVKGFYYWTLMNGYEWNHVNDTLDFGLYKNRVENHTTGALHQNYNDHDAMLTAGGKHYKAIIAKQRNITQ